MIPQKIKNTTKNNLLTTVAKSLNAEQTLIVFKSSTTKFRKWTVIKFQKRWMTWTCHRKFKEIINQLNALLLQIPQKIRSWHQTWCQICKITRCRRRRQRRLITWWYHLKVNRIIYRITRVRSAKKRPLRSTKGKLRSWVIILSGGLSERNRDKSKSKLRLQVMA